MDISEEGYEKVGINGDVAERDGLDKCEVGINGDVAERDGLDKCEVGINGDVAERDGLDKCGRRNMNSTGECR